LQPGRPLADLSVEDDAPNGFRHLEHAYTLFASSYKKAEPAKRGRFNLGEKLVLAMCREAQIATTTGTVVFGPEGQRQVRPRSKRERGSRFEATLRLTRDEYDAAATYLRSLLLPAGVNVTFNGEALPARQPVRAFEATLDTELADEEGVLRRRTRKTQVQLYEPSPGEAPTLYELGLPVVETGDRWHVNIGQKVPLTWNRDNVPPGYLQAVRVSVLNAAHDLLSAEEDATAGWCKLAGADPRCSDAATRHLVRLRFGDKVAAPDPSDVEAMKAFQAQGGTIVAGLSRGEWANVRRSGAVLPAGQICPTAKPYSQDPTAPPVHIVPPENWSPGMRNAVAYAAFLGQELLNVPITVAIVRTHNRFNACYGGRELHLNLLHLGHRWFDQGPGEEMDALLLHEFGHEYSVDHLSEDYYEALCGLGARLKQLALVKPEALRKFTGAATAGSVE